MSRQMPQLAQAFADGAARAEDFARAIERARDALGTKDAKTYLPIARLELAYELSYLRMFTAWEDFLEQGLLRYLCGYAAGHGQEPLQHGVYCSNLAAAKGILYGGQQFLLWHNPQRVIARATGLFLNSRHAAVIASIQGRLQNFASIRHRIAHAHGEREFDVATMALAGRRYRGSRPGRFLRDWAHHGPTPMRWLEVIAFEFRGLAFQIVPP